MYKYKRYMHYFDKWMENREHGHWIADYFTQKGAPSIAIYGCGMLGRHLIWELEKMKYPISWIMDKGDSSFTVRSKIIGINEVADAPKVDLIIVTAMADYEEIEKFLCNHDIGRPIGLDELINIISSGVK